MASQLLPPSPPPTPTAITSLSDDLLRNIFLRLPALPSLVCAAFACRDFHRAVHSSPAFRRSFCMLHAPLLLAFFLDPKMEAAPVVPSGCLRSDPLLPLLSHIFEPKMDADFFGVNLSCHDEPQATGWEFHNSDPNPPSDEGYLILKRVSGSTAQRAAYNPLTQGLCLFLHEPDFEFEFYTLSSENGKGPSHVVYVRHCSLLADSTLAETTAVVLSCDTMEWQFSRKASVRLHKPKGHRSAMVVSGLICWPEWIYDQIVVLDTSTSHFSLIDLPTPLKKTDGEATYKLGETKDHKFCIVDIKEEILVSWFMTADDDSVVERWMMYKNFSLHPIVKEFTGWSMEEDFCNVTVGLVAVIDGFVYLSISYGEYTQDFMVYLSLCLETSKMSELFKGAYQYNSQAHPYFMAWPRSLVHSKEDSETEFTRDSFADDGPAGTREASYFLVAALQLLSHAPMHDGDRNKEMVAELDAFLGPTKDDEGSLIRKMTTLDAQLRNARDTILRMRA